MKIGFVLALLVVTLMAGTGVFMLWNGVGSLKRAMAAERWPTASADVLHVELKEETDSEGSRTYSVDVQYHYQVAGRSYTGNTLSPGYGASTGPAPHQKLFEKIRSAKTLEVRYNPQFPEQSSIAYGASRSTFINMAFALTATMVALGFFTVMLAFLTSDERLLTRIKVLEPQVAVGSVKQ